MAREVREIEITSADSPSVLAEMARLAEARAGWINILPGVDEDELADEGGRSVFSAVFGGSSPPVAMGSWFPPGSGRRGVDGATVGVMHPTGPLAVRRLVEAGVPLPDGWRVRQDHPRRGLIVEPTPGTPDRTVLDWVLRSTATLTTATLTGTWQARVFGPERIRRR
jgi:hypothetical protein